MKISYWKVYNNYTLTVYKIIKKIALIVTILLANFGFAQENTPSPYSFYGIGSTKFKGTNDIVNTGGISVYSDSTHINVLNPASFSNQIVTTFQVGLTSSFYKLNSASNTEKAQKSTFDYLIMAIWQDEDIYMPRYSLYGAKGIQHKEYFTQLNTCDLIKFNKH